MSTYKLTYFDFDGGRGEPVRIAFHMAGIDFEDKRITFSEFGELRKDWRFNAVPVLEIDGAAVTQSNAMCRFVGKMAGLYPADSLQALYCDEAMGAIEDLSNRIVQTFGLEGDELKLAREKLADGWLAVFLRGLNELLVRGGGEYFADDQLTIADLKVFVLTRWLTSGSLDHIPTDLVQRLAPALVDHQDRVERDPRVAAYYASRS
ncbi:MAG: glutathione S-transferase family protein [Gammaproteobacteria bacterium]|jgi:glutathione S-transferase|nr:glutathione S-transferase family protein [Gammaproteobacteria bacterium]